MAALIHRESPMLRIILPYGTGIWLQDTFDLPLTILLAGLALSILSVFIYNHLKSIPQYRARLFAGIIMLALPAFAGMLTLFLREPRNFNNWIGNLRPSVGGMLLRLSEDPQEKSRSYASSASIIQAGSPEHPMPVSGSIQISFLKDSSRLGLGEGDLIWINKAPDSIRNTSNPGGFDYQKYLWRQGISHQVFLLRTEYCVVKKGTISLAGRALKSLRRIILHAIRTYIPGREEAGLAEALLIGYKEDLDKDLVQSYSNTGVVHVIAISGLHLALIYWLLGKACDKLKANKKLVRPLVILSGLWIFALLAGASPSVVRSAVMFSVIVVGELINRKANILNSLAASAFLLLAYEPYWLWDLGFQLSYLAVLSLVILAKPVYDCFYIVNPLLDNGWKLISVTLAAQVLTTPICLYQFHRFPLLFIFTNGICVPLSSLILVGELILCCFSWLPAVASITGKLLFYLLQFMNSVVRYFDEYPISTFKPVQIDAGQTLLLYLCIATFLLYGRNRNLRFLMAAFFCLVCFCLLRLQSFQKAERQQKMVIYNSPGRRAIDYFNGRTVYFAGDTSIFSNPRLYQQVLEGSRIQARAYTRQGNFLIFTPDRINEFHGLRIAWLSGGKAHFLPGNSPDIDLLVLSDNTPMKKLTMLSRSRLRVAVADGSNSRRLVKQYRRFFNRCGIPFYSVQEEGAFVMNLN